MTSRMEQIYEELYSKVLAKEYLSSKHKVSTKTIENTINGYLKETPNDIVYDTKIAAYRFKNLLPHYIPYRVFFILFESSIANKIIKEDFLLIGKVLNVQLNSNTPMIETSALSPLAQKLIKCTIAIKQNSILQIDYKGHKKDNQTKLVIPHKITSMAYSYYLYGIYDKANRENIGESRSFALTGMGSISSFKYIKDQKFAIGGVGNAYGMIDKENYIILRLQGNAANFFKREGLFQEDIYDFITEEADGSVLMKMYYSHLDEVVHLLQRWMPLIEIQDSSLVTKEVYEKISENYNKLVLKEKR